MMVFNSYNQLLKRLKAMQMSVDGYTVQVHV
jgi:hypothetical protein